MLRGRPRTRHDRTRLVSVAIAVLVAVFLVAAAGESTANTVDAISWGHDSDGNTTITIVCAEPLESSSFRSYPIADPPRAVIVIQGVSNRVKPDVMNIEDSHVTRLRLGYPVDANPPQLNIILDLTSEASQILDLLHTGRRIVAVVGSPYRPRATNASESPAVPEFSPLPESPLVPEPSSTPSPRPTESPPTPTMVSSTIPVSTPPDRPDPPVMPAIAATPTSTRTSSSMPTEPAVVVQSPTPEAEPAAANHVVDIVASLRNDGSTLLRITANGRIPQGIARTLEITDDPPRIILSLRGMSAPDLPRTIDIGDPNLARIRLVHDAETSEGELHLVLHLERPGVSVIELNQVGPHLVLQLAVEKPTAPVR